MTDAGREQFERWARKAGYLAAREGEGYFTVIGQTAWEAWQAAYDAGAAAENEAWGITLREHWLNSIECLHVIRSDISHCACGWKSCIQANVGLAIERWIDHVNETIRARREQAEVKS